MFTVDETSENGWRIIRRDSKDALRDDVGDWRTSTGRGVRLLRFAVSVFPEFSAGLRGDLRGRRSRVAKSSRRKCYLCHEDSLLSDTGSPVTIAKTQAIALLIHEALVGFANRG
jgi:hypothetical protein